MRIDSIRPATVREAMAAEYGDDWQKHGPNHAFDVVNTYRTNGLDQLVIHGTENNDTMGHDDAVTVANYRVLYDAWSHLEGLSRGPWSNVDVIALDVDLEAPEDLTEVLDRLADYPVLDEQEWSNVEQEMIQEHWESYGKHDVLQAVGNAIGVASDYFTTQAEDIITALVWEGILDYGPSGGYPTMIDVSACDFGEKEIAEWFTDHIGTVVKVNTGDMWRDERTFDLNRTNIIA